MAASLFVSEVTEVKKLSLVVLLVLFSACKGTQEGEAIHATVKLDPAVSASCVLFEVRDTANPTASQKTCLTRAGKNELQVGILRGALSPTVELAARPYLDCTCTQDESTKQVQLSSGATANGQPVVQPASFTKVFDQPVVLMLAPGKDEDTDGYVSSSDGGEDCNDAPGGKGVHPHQTEVCSDQVDLNCNNKKGCEEVAGCPVNACIGPPVALALTLPATPVKAGECTAGSVQVKDVRNSDTTVVAATPVSLTAAPTGGIAFYSDANCTASVTSLSVAAGSGSASFFFQGQATGLITVSAKSTNLTTAMQNVQVDPGVGNRLVFPNAPVSAVSNVCSGKVTVESRDAQNNAKPVTAATQISLSATQPTGFKLYSDAGCTATNEVTSVTMAMNTNVANFYFKGTVAGDVMVTVTAPGFTGSTQVEKIIPGPAKLIVVTGPTSTQAGACSTQGTITLQDAQGNPTTAAAATTINLTFAGKALTFSATGACAANVTSVSIASGSGTAPFFYRGTVAGASTITAAGTGLTSGTLGVTIAPGPATLLSYTTPVQSLTAGNCSAVTTVQFQDTFGNPAPVSVDTVVSLTAALPDNFQFFSSAGCSTVAVSAVTILAGASDASFYFKGTRSGTVMVTATSGAISKTQNETINPATATALVLSPSTLSVAAGACTQLTVQLQDTFGNLSTVNPAQTVTLAASPSTNFTFHATNACGAAITSVSVAANQSSATFYVRGNTVNTVTVTATDAPLTAATATVMVSPGLPSKVVFRTTQQTVLSRACSSLTTVELQDSLNNQTTSASGTTINLTASIGTVTFYSDPACATQVTSVPVGAGQSSANFYFKDNAVGAETPTLTAAGASLTSGTQQATINPEAPTELFFLTSSQTLTAGGCSGQVSVQTRAQGNPTAYTTATIVTPNGTGLTFFANGGCSGPSATFSINAGSATTSFYFKGTTAGSITLTAHSGTLTDATQTETINAGVPSQGAIITPVLTTVAGACAGPVTVESRDSYGNVSPTPVSVVLTLQQSGNPTDPNFKFYSDPSCSTVVTTIPLNATQSTASFYYRGELARTVNLAVTFGGAYSTPVQAHTVTPAALNKLTFASSTPAQTLLAATCVKRTVERRDAFGNLVPDTSATIVTPTGSTLAEFFLDATCTVPAPTVSIDANTTSADFYFKGYSGGINAAASLTLTLASAPLASAAQVETIKPTVRTGSCMLSGTSVQCAITPQLDNANRAFLLFQATSTNASSAQTNVLCKVISVTQIQCERGSNMGADVSIRWSIAEFPGGSLPNNGLVSQHIGPACSADTTSVTITTGVTTTQSFLLLSGVRNINDQGSSAPRLAELMSTASAQIRKTGGCGAGDTNSLQVVDYAGASVQRGLANVGATFASTMVGIPSSVVPDRSIVLYSYIYDSNTTKICDRLVRGEIINTGANLNFSRGNGDVSANCTGTQINSISWEVVQFPSGTLVQPFTKSLTAGMLTDFVTLGTSVDLSRTLVIGGGQWASGQLHGESSYSGGEVVGEGRAQAVLTNGTRVDLTRANSNASATFSGFVVQFKP